MSLFNVIDVAGTAMNAQSVRLNVTASNLANAGSVSGDPDKGLPVAATHFRDIPADAR